MVFDKNWTKHELKEVVDKLNNVYGYLDSIAMDAYRNDDDDNRFYIEDIMDKVNDSLDMAYQAHASI